jgi:salicylate hydroxylase
MQEYFNFHRIDMHNVLLDTVKAESSEEMGPQGQIMVNHKAVEISAEKGFIKFENGSTRTADLIIAADGIRVCLREKWPYFGSSLTITVLDSR